MLLIQGMCPAPIAQWNKAPRCRRSNCRGLLSDLQENRAGLCLDCVKSKLAQLEAEPPKRCPRCFGRGTEWRMVLDSRGNRVRKERPCRVCAA